VAVKADSDIENETGNKVIERFNFLCSLYVCCGFRCALLVAAGPVCSQNFNIAVQSSLPFLWLYSY